MKVIVPLAGPDFESADGRVKSEMEFEGLPLLQHALESRSWRRRGQVRNEDYTFVLRDTPASRRFAGESLSQWYPNASQVFLSAFTQGAAFSVLAGVALIGHTEEPVCFDLADIIFEDETDVLPLFAEVSVGAVGLTFPSKSPLYSYFRRDPAGHVVETAEKRVISNEASTGVYLVRSPEVYLRALAHVLQNRAQYLHRQLFFVCPVMNGVLDQGLIVRGLLVSGVRDVKMS